MSEPLSSYKNEKFVVTDEPVMKLAISALEILNKSNIISIIGKDALCSTAVSVANILTQNFLKNNVNTEKILIDSEILDDGRLISTIEIIIKKN